MKWMIGKLVRCEIDGQELENQERGEITLQIGTMSSNDCFLSTLVPVRGLRIMADLDLEEAIALRNNLDVYIEMTKHTNRIDGNYSKD